MFAIEFKHVQFKHQFYVHGTLVRDASPATYLPEQGAVIFKLDGKNVMKPWADVEYAVPILVATTDERVIDAVLETKNASTRIELPPRAEPVVGLPSGVKRRVK